MTLSLGADAAVDPAVEDLKARADRGQRAASRWTWCSRCPVAGCSTQCADALAPFGRIVAYGIAGREQNTLETGRLMRKSRAVIGFWLMHCLGRRDMMEEPLADLFERAARGELRAPGGDHLPALRGAPGPRGPAGPAHERQAAAGPLPLASGAAA